MTTNNDNGDDEKEAIDDEKKRNNAMKQWVRHYIKLSTVKSNLPSNDQAQARNRNELQKLPSIQGNEIGETNSNLPPIPDNADCQSSTSVFSTDAFGDVKFVGYGQKIAKFVRVDYETPMETIIDLITVQWNLPLPKLFISVTGGRKKFQLKPHRKEAFGHGLVKAARSTGAWVISAGLHAGVVKYIGKAIHDNECSLSGNNKVVTISIALWNCVQNKESLENEDGSWPAEYNMGKEPHQNMCALDPNHSHFILVDNGTTEISNEDIKFRKMLENTIKEKKIQGNNTVKIPAVVVMVEGGPGTLKSVCDSISRNIPVVIVKGSGRAADIMAYAYQKMFEDETYRSQLKKLKVVIRKQITTKFGKNEQVEPMVNLVLDSVNKPNLITIFEIDSAEEFDVTILKAVFKANNNEFENLRLALEWNRIDIAKSEIFTDGTYWPPDKWVYPMLFALREDRVDFVKLFLEYGVSLKELLTDKNIENLYKMASKLTFQYSKVDKESKDISIKDGVPLFHKLVDEYALLQKKAGKNRLSAIYQSNLPITTKLFLWALFLNRKEMAFLFLKGDMEVLPLALIANKLLKSLKLKCSDYDKRIKFQEHADLYEECAIGVLTECYHADEKRTLDLLLLQRKTWNDASCMQIAFNVNNKKFVSQPACQSLLSKMWIGSISTNNSTLKLLLCTFCPLFIFLINFDDKQDYNGRNNKLNQKSRICPSSLSKVLCRCVTFYCTPFIKFLNNLIFYVIFLVIYSYVLLVELKPQMSYLEWLLLVWVIGIFTEEIHQLLTRSSMSLWIRFTNYINDFWNIVDVITISLFVFGVILRFLKMMDATRVVLNLNLISFFIRILYMLSSHRHLGPKLVMIKKMIQDLGYFIVILLVFMIAFGISTQSILYPSTPVSYDLFKAVFRKAYFHMYGELFLEEYEENIKSNLIIFQKVQERSYHHWSFQRYELIYEFSVRPPLPPPFILLSNIYQFCHYLHKKARNAYQKRSVFSKQFDVNRSKHLILWEDQMVDSYISKKDISVSDNLYEKVISSSNRIDQLALKVEELQHNVEEKIEEGLHVRMENVKKKLDTITALLNRMQEQTHL
ncbi:transient receptor potential cation channel subfamily M member-like 2 isoform X4 [Octopus vulgaris]|uniref:Transient receptor potential cation channel subfamily M member-like 2 isoform X4 n=1 Tax=Octopus vulgaris TaxID=6645 RepID=A0AA36BK31_OCTVU|nr:transient receptor potential cation channel subfamily M member-like 2 isoform X4 [Octopus vulgaris]